MKSSVIISIIIASLALGPTISSTKFAHFSILDLLPYADLLDGAFDRGCMDITINNYEDCLVLANNHEQLTKRFIPRYWLQQNRGRVFGKAKARMFNFFRILKKANGMVNGNC